MGIFDNASSVSIGGKEVQSLKLASNNAVLYEKVSDNYLLTLSSNKNILSNYDNDSATITATLTNNGVGVIGETIVFSFPYDDNYTSRTISANTETTVGRKYVITTSFPENNSTTTYLDSEHKVKIVTRPGDGAVLFVDGTSISGDFSYNFSVEDGVISWKVSSSSYSYDCSGYDLSVIKSTINLNINDYGGYYRVDTDNDGVATCTYSSQGVGDVTITAECMSLQETYSIEDCIYNLDSSTDKSSQFTPYLCEGGTTGSVSYDTDHHTLSGGSKTTSYLLTSMGVLTNCEITMKIKPTSNSFSGAIGLAFQESTGNVVGFVAYSAGHARKVKYSGGRWVESYSAYYSNEYDSFGDYIEYTLLKQGNTITLKQNETFVLPSNSCYIGFMKGTGTVYFKNLKIKPF